MKPRWHLNRQAEVIFLIILSLFLFFLLLMMSLIQDEQRWVVDHQPWPAGWSSWSGVVADAGPGSRGPR